MRRLLAAVIFASLLSISVSAGEIPTSGVTSTTPPATQTAAPGEIPSVPGEIPSVDSSLQSEALLDFIQLMIGLTV